MQRILYTMNFKGRMTPEMTESRSLRTRGSATSCLVSTTIRPAGVESNVSASDGDLAFLDSELRVTGPDSFQENGTITFGECGEHVLRFSTVGQGHLAPSLEPGSMAGTASWKVEGGSGQFAAARGFINSVFMLVDSGEFNNVHCGWILLPE